MNHEEKTEEDFPENVYIMDLTIPFNKIVGVSARQEWYANCLRNEYVAKNEERFREIEELMERENDRRILGCNEFEDLCEGTIQEEYSEAERAVLFGVSASGIIATLKEAMGK